MIAEIMNLISQTCSYTKWHYRFLSEKSLHRKLARRALRCAVKITDMFSKDIFDLSNCILTFAYSNPDSRTDSFVNVKDGFFVIKCGDWLIDFNSPLKKFSVSSDKLTFEYDSKLILHGSRKYFWETTILPEIIRVYRVYLIRFILYLAERGDYDE